MAVAEARAVWQRTANRCFVQEDAKRAPKLACCQSSSSSSKQVDTVPTNAAGMPENSALAFMPLHWSPSYSNLSPDTRWWLQIQPSYGYQTGFTYDQLNALEAELETLRAEMANSLSKENQLHDDKASTHFDGNKSDCSCFDPYSRSLTGCRCKDPEVKIQESMALDKDRKENSKLMDTGPFECFRRQKIDEHCFDSESPHIGGEKDVPWWHTTDKDDLASLVAHKSFDYIANCDLPPPQKMHVQRRYPHGRLGSFDHDDMVSSSMDWKAQNICVSSPIVHIHGSPSSGITHHRASIKGRLQSCSNNPFSSSTTHNDMKEIGQIPEGDLCKAQLLEALRHSQTRAREAENMAKQACAEKEHIIKLIFRQASQLFAYEQWFKLLQLETLYYQVKNGVQPNMSTLLPVAFPWLPQKRRKLQKNWQKPVIGKQVKPRQPSKDGSKYVLALALGLGLVGAGLLLGWTVAWMLPI